MRTITRQRRPSPGQHRPEVSLEQLRAFAAVAEREHVTRAAEALNMSQGSVSALVRRLEEALDLPLLRRVGRNVRLTDVGTEVQRLAAQVLGGVALIQQLPQTYAGLDAGEVRVASGRLMGAHRLSGWLAPFISEHPKVRVHITLAPRDRLVGLLLGGEADVVVSGDTIVAPGVTTMVLERTQVVLVVAATHALARSRTPLDEFAGHRWLEHEGGSSTAMRAASLFAGLQPADAVEFEEGALLAALLAGLGYAAMPHSVVEDDVRKGRLVVLPNRGPRVYQEFTAARREGPQTPAVRAFWEHLARLGRGASR
ncbi:MAG: LysR family transcriptional regulator [Candidatus Dormibacteraeota bacterium]|nr:LysR family transcriptional regulator [Candidatus Dormibacteraeota bacterium]MBV9525490.1 LysR family transcriptional regulator [Candidatus Dormibacteraeota bacterium]